jgi:6,7-dimethyl-8-ribityllumazine synthase
VNGANNSRDWHYNAMMSTSAPKSGGLKIATRTRVAIIAARWNEEIVEELLAGCLRQLEKLGASRKKIEVHRVPGAYELPYAARMLAGEKKFDAVICLGCVIRGDTPHFDYVAGECARGIMQVNLLGICPVIFGVLTVNTDQQARERIGGKHGHNGERAADAAAEMIAFGRAAQ